MKNLLLILVFALSSCTKMVYKTYKVPPTISLENTSYKTIKIVDLKSRQGNGSLESYIMDYDNEFALDSFKNKLQKSLKDRTKLKVIHAPSTREIIHLRLAEKELPESKADLLVYGIYQEVNGSEPYSYDTVGSQSKMWYSEGRFSFKIVDRKTGEIVHTDTVSSRKRESATSGNVFTGKTTIETIAIANRNNLAWNFSNVFLETERGKYVKAEQ